MMLEHPLLPSHPHPQFVAAKSLILKSSVDLIYSSYYVEGMSVFPLFLWFSCVSFFHNGKLIFFGESVIELRMRKNYAIVPMIVFEFGVTRCCEQSCLHKNKT